MDDRETVRVIDDPRDTGHVRLILQGRITIAHVAAFHNTARVLGERGRNVTIDCTAVEYLDVAAVQVLLCLERALGPRGSLVGLSAAVLADFRLLGLGTANPAPGASVAAPASRWQEAIRTVEGFHPSAAN